MFIIGADLNNSKSNRSSLLDKNAKKTRFDFEACKKTHSKLQMMKSFRQSSFHYFCAEKRKDIFESRSLIV
jgi:hypothetical protein